MNAQSRLQPADRLTPSDEGHADTALLHLSMFRDSLVIANERVAAEHVEAAILLIQDACRTLLTSSVEREL